MKKEICVGIIEPVGGHGGMNYYDMGLAKGLVAQGAKVNWYTCDKTHEIEYPGIRIVKCFNGIYGKQHKLVRFTRFLRGLLVGLRDIKHQGGRLVHFHFFHLSILELLCVCLSKFFRLSTIITVHDVDSFSGNNHPFIAKSILRLVDRFIVHNNISLLRLSEVLASFNLNKPIQIIPHGHYLDNVNVITQAQARTALNLPVNRKILLFFGQVKAVKGLDVLLNAMKTVIVSHPDVLLVIAGKVWKDDFGMYQKIIEHQDLQSNIRLDIRYIPDDEVANYYCAADFVILPYKKIFQSGVLLMAMSYGIPVITSDILGMTEVVEDGVNGLTFKTEDSDSLSNRIQCALLMNQDDMKKLSNNALELMKIKYSWDRIGQLTLLEYDELNK